MKNCKYSIRILREQLDKLLESKGTAAQEVLELSQKLDKLILEYYYKTACSASLPGDSRFRDDIPAK
jgi:hypothetical protein